MTIDDHEKALLGFASEVVSKVLARGKDTHEPGEWFNQSLATHVDHAYAHLENMDEIFQWGGEWAEDAENALCRLTFILYLKSLEAAVLEQAAQP